MTDRMAAMGETNMPDNDPGVLARELREMAVARHTTMHDGQLMRRAADYLESRAPVGGTVGEPALTRLEEIAQFLWALLDDIDTASDVAKADHEVYRTIVERIQRRRFEVGTTDGYTVSWKAEGQANGVSGSPSSPKQTSGLEFTGGPK